MGLLKSKRKKAFAHGYFDKAESLARMATIKQLQKDGWMLEEIKKELDKKYGK